MRDAYIIGTGMIRFGRYPDLLVEDFAKEAVGAALVDSGIDRRRIGMAVFGHSNGGRVAGQRVLREISLTGMAIVNVENACAGGGTALHTGWMGVASGLHDVALVVGMEKMEKGLIPPNPGEYEAFLGKTLPAKYALRAKKHMARYGLTAEQLAMVSVKNHRAGALNPDAHYQDEITLEAVLASRMIAEPLTLLQCCPTTDGAAALVIASGEVARASGQPAIRIAASVLTSGIYSIPAEGSLGSDDDLPTRAAAAAYEMAGLAPTDVDVAEVHDAFTIGEILAYENLGFCPRGEGGRLIDEGVTALGGRLPVNPSGGRLSLGHPLGATGVAQVVELTRQLQGRCGPRQVPNARTALAHVQGGSTPGIGTGAWYGPHPDRRWHTRGSVNGRLQDRVAIVTGGAGVIGTAIARQFSREGARVVIADLDTSRQAEFIAGLNVADPSRVSFVETDARDDSQVRAMVASVIADHGQVDVLVATVGGSQDALIHKMTDEQWDQVMDLNLRTTFFACRAVVPHMIEKRYGKIVLISSRSYLGNVGQANYSAAKAGLVGFTSSLAREMARHHVNVNCVVPGFIENPRTALMPEKYRQMRIELNPFQDMAEPEDVADAILFLSSDESRQVTGQALRVACW